jgi:murein DD-endopeptidase MepM/ murein hydrolase activator NlpD
MSKKQENESWKKLKQKFRLLILEESSYQELLSFRISKLDVIMVFGGLGLLSFAFSYIAFAYTPLNYFMPSWRNKNEQYAYRQMLSKLDSIERRTYQQDLYITDLKKWLKGEFTQDSLVFDTVNLPRMPKEKLLPPSIDSMLRKELDGTKLNAVNKENLSKLFLVAPMRQSEIADKFKPAASHYGIDLVAPEGTPILSIASGVVVQAVFTAEHGYVITVQHQNNLVSIYKHNSDLLKKEGESVKAGEPIAIIGNTGKETTGAHLHFELWENGVPIDPLLHISF